MKKPARPTRKASSRQALLEEMLRRLKTGGDLRRQKVSRIRRSLRESGYENDLKLQVAVERLGREIGLR